MNPPDIQAALNPVINAFAALGIVYYVGGSVGSSVYGIPRTTPISQGRLTLKLLQETYYLNFASESLDL